MTTIVPESPTEPARTDDGAGPRRRLAEQLARTAGERAQRPVVVRLSSPGLPGSPAVRASHGPTGPEVPVLLVASSVLVGPAWRAGARGPCSDCLVLRWTETRPSVERDLLERPLGVLAASSLPLLTGFVTEVVADLVAQALLHRPSDPGDGLGRVARVDLTTGAVDRFGLLASSTCSTCSRPARDTADAADPRFAPRPKRAHDDYRLSSPDDLRLPLDTLVNPVCGVLGTTALRAYQSNANAPVTGFFQSRSKYGLHEMWWSGHAGDYATSELLGMLEGLERHAGQQPRAKDTARLSRARDLDVPYLPADACGAYAPEFYRNHAESYVPWSDDVLTRWVWGWSLRDERAVLVPEQLAYYLDRHTDTQNSVQECSNGCASGSTVEEAVLHGLLELAERDAFLITWYAGISPPEIDLTGLRSPETRAMVARVGHLGYDLHCYDIRVDLPVPVVAGVAVRRDGGPGLLCFAAGASLDPEQAVRAAVCEVASYVPGFDQRVTDAGPELDVLVHDWHRVCELKHHALLYGRPEMSSHAERFLGGAAPRPVEELYAGWLAQRRSTGDLTDDVRELVGLVTSTTGSDVVVVDQTSPEQAALGLAACCVIAPGLVPIDFGWDRQRALSAPRVRTAPVTAGLVPPGSPGVVLQRAPHPFP